VNEPTAVDVPADQGAVIGVIRYDAGVHRNKLSVAREERRAGVAGTAGNLGTAEKLAALR